MRRCAVAISVVSILAGMLPGSARAANEITFGATSNTAFNLAHYVATEKKYYESENLKVEAVVVGAAAGVLQQLAAGSLNVAQVATDQSLRAILRGAPIRIVAGAAADAPFRLVAAKTAKSWSDLRHKTISVGGLTDVTLYFLRVMARYNGLADRDYDLLYGGATPNRFAQLASGAVAAAILTNPVDFAALEQGYVDLGSVQQYLPNWAQNNIVTDTRWAAQHAPCWSPSSAQCLSRRHLSLYPRLGAPRVDLDQQAATQSRVANARSPKERGPGLVRPTPPIPSEVGASLGSLDAMEAAATEVSARRQGLLGGHGCGWGVAAGGYLPGKAYATRRASHPHESRLRPKVLVRKHRFGGILNHDRNL
jgi:NMT1/THI5 like